MKAQIFGLVGLELLALSSDMTIRDYLANVRLYSPSGTIEHISQFPYLHIHESRKHFDRYEKLAHQKLDYIAERNKRWHNCKRTKRIPAGGGLR